MNKLYREVSVWKRRDDRQARRFRCLEDLQSGLYCVQSADVFTLPITSAHLAQLDHQFVELLIEIDPLKRCKWYDSLAEAVAEHEKEFAAMISAVLASEGREPN